MGLNNEQLAMNYSVIISQNFSKNLFLEQFYLEFFSSRIVFKRKIQVSFLIKRYFPDFSDATKIF